MFYDEEWDYPNDNVRYMKQMENDRANVFLAGLNKDSKEVKGQILSKKPLPSVGKVFFEVRREEARRNVMLNREPQLNALISKRLELTKMEIEETQKGLSVITAKKV